MIGDPGKLSPSFKANTDWLVRKICNSEPSVTKNSVVTANEIIANLHESLPKSCPTILAYRNKNCEAIPISNGKKMSKKRKFDEAIENSDLNLFRKKNQRLVDFKSIRYHIDKLQENERNYRERRHVISFWNKRVMG